MQYPSSQRKGDWNGQCDHKDECQPFRNVQPVDCNFEQAKAEQELGKIDQWKLYGRAPVHGLAEDERCAQCVGKTDTNRVADCVGNLITHPDQQDQIHEVGYQRVYATHDQKAQKLAMNKPIHYFTKSLKQFRDDRDWSQQQLADFLTLQLGKEISRTTVNYWENQQRAVNAELALSIASATKMQVMDLVEQKADGK